MQKAFLKSLSVFFSLFCLFCMSMLNLNSANATIKSEIVGNNSANYNNVKVVIYCDTAESCILFAAKDLKTILINKGAKASLKPLSEIPNNPTGIYFVISKDEPIEKSKLLAVGGKNFGNQKDQTYVLRNSKTKSSTGYWVLGGDRIGAMYGGIHLGELVKAGMLDYFKDEEH